jgi:hypothetical protein
MGMVTLTRPLFAGGLGLMKVEEGSGGDDEEPRYEEEGGKRDARGEPEGPDGELDGDLNARISSRTTSTRTTMISTATALNRVAARPPISRRTPRKTGSRSIRGSTTATSSTSDEMWLDQPLSERARAGGG